MKLDEFIEKYNKDFEKKYPNKGFFIFTYQVVPNRKFPVYKQGMVNIMHIPSREICYSLTFQDKIVDNTKMKPKYRNLVMKELKDKKKEIMENYGTRS